MSEPEHVDSSSEVLLRGGTKPNNLNNFSNGRSTGAMEKYSLDYQNLEMECIRLRKYLFGLTAVVVAGGLILVVTISVLFGKLSHDLVHHSHQPKVGEQIAKILETEELCVPCDSVRLGPSEDEDRMLDAFIRRSKPTGEECCVEKPKQLLAVLELVSKTYVDYVCLFFYVALHCINTSGSDKMSIRFNINTIQYCANTK